jgi:tetratricopeptide (TPR) repeat protein
MGTSIRIFFLLVIVIGMIGFLGFSLNGEKSLNDFKKEGECPIEKNEYEKAIFYYDKILLNEPNSIMILSEKANVLISLNKFEQAIKIFDIILELDPANDHVKESRALTIQKINVNSIKYDII